MLPSTPTVMSAHANFSMVVQKNPLRNRRYSQMSAATCTPRNRKGAQAVPLPVPNATPVLCTRTMLKFMMLLSAITRSMRRPISVVQSYGKLSTMYHLVVWSSRYRTTMRMTRKTVSLLLAVVWAVSGTGV